MCWHSLNVNFQIQFHSLDGLHGVCGVVVVDVVLKLTVGIACLKLTWQTQLALSYQLRYV